MAHAKSALIVVDFQEDFCPPTGSLAVAEGRDIAPTVNKLLSLPFALKIATKDWHPPNHVSFASNHKGKEPFVDQITIQNPSNPKETYETRLWPVHCVQKTPGAVLVPELDVEKLDKIISKGTDARVEMYSPFCDPFEQPRVCDSGLARVLKEGGITMIVVVGLAADYCVLNCAVDAVKEGFKTYIIEEGTRPVDPAAWQKWKQQQMAKEGGVSVISLESEDAAWMMRLT